MKDGDEGKEEMGSEESREATVKTDLTLSKMGK